MLEIGKEYIEYLDGNIKKYTSVIYQRIIAVYLFSLMCLFSDYPDIFIILGLLAAYDGYLQIDLLKLVKTYKRDYQGIINIIGRYNG